jgi:hypothetical protein
VHSLEGRLVNLAFLFPADVRILLHGENGTFTHRTKRQCDEESSPPGGNSHALDAEFLGHLRDGGLWPSFCTGRLGIGARGQV